MISYCYYDNRKQVNFNAIFNTFACIYEIYSVLFFKGYPMAPKIAIYVKAKFFENFDQTH